MPEVCRTLGIAEQTYYRWRKEYGGLKVEQARRFPHTSLDIVQVTDGPRAGEFLFSSETVRRANGFYQRVKHLPHLTTGTEGFYQRYISTPGRLLAPKWSAWVVDLPDWTQSVYYGQTVWQWAALGLTLLALFSVLSRISQMNP